MLPLLLFIAFLLVPVVEIYVIIQVGQLIGGWQTVALLLAESILGAWIVRREGRRAWQALQEAILKGVMPDRELADAGLVLVGGVLLLTPGFVTDLVGFWFVLPFTRPLVRRLLTMYISRRVRVAQQRMGLPTTPDGHRGEPRVVSGEVVTDDQEKGPGSGGSA